MNTIVQELIQQEMKTQVIQFPGSKKEKRNDSMIKTDGNPKAKPADPIRDKKYIKIIRDDLLERGKIRDYALITLGLTLGIRGSDLLKLRVGDVWDGKFVKSEIIIIEKKTRKTNRLNIIEEAANALRLYINERIKKEGSLDLTDYLFISRETDINNNHRPITIRQFNRIMEDQKKRHNIPGNISSHSLRKTFVYHLIRDERTTASQLTTIQQMLNHSSFAVTLRYCGITDEEKVEMRTWLNDLF